MIRLLVNLEFLRSSQHRSCRAAFLIAVCALSLGCTSDPVSTGNGEQDPGEGVLFIGSSLTYVNDLPGILEALADSAGGERIPTSMVAYGGFALVDHWNTGGSRSEIARGGWDYVVLQQGPSAAQINRDSLRLLTGWFSEEIEAVDARPALYSVWPSRERTQDFERAIESYTLAADDVDGLLLPVASAWLAVWNRDPNVELYSFDGVHPTPAASYLAALVMYARILNKTPIGLPASVITKNGIGISLSSQLAALLQSAAAEVTGFPTQ
jgi:hypothetical protein